MLSVSPWFIASVVLLAAFVGAGVMAVSDIIIEKMQQRERARHHVECMVNSQKLAQMVLVARTPSQLDSMGVHLTPGQQERFDAIKKGIRPEFVREVFKGADPAWVERQVKNLCDSDE
jgi:hypothetical protein